MNFEEKLQKVKETKEPLKTRRSEAMNYLGVKRRGWRVDLRINKLLDKYDLIAEPPFEEAWKWGEVIIKAKPKVRAGKSKTDDNENDPTPRLSILKAANLSEAKEAGISDGLITVKRDDDLNKATTLMFRYGFSQLPVMSGIRNPEGLISWKSIGKALALNKKCLKVKDCMEEVKVLSFNAPLFDAVKIILEEEVVLVKQKDKTISGIITSTDIGEQFIALSEPFLIVEQIENHIRRLLDGKFSLEELKKAIEPIQDNRDIQTLSDLNFGEYVRIMENPDNFKKIGINVDRKYVVKLLDKVREIRNDIMHFDPDGGSDDDIKILKETAKFLHEITSIIKKK